MTKAKWLLKTAESVSYDALAKALHISPLTVRLIAARGYKDIAAIESFLNPRLETLHDPFLMKDLSKAVQRILKAIERKEKILVYGDYDVDGLSSTALLLLVLKQVGAQASSYIPHRMEEGYGLHAQVLPYAQQHQISLLITVDCGTSAHEEITLLSNHGIDVIVTDHHELSEKAPAAYAVVNPLQKDCPYPFKQLAGVGIVFKLIQGLLRDKDKHDLCMYLDLVALGTIADMVPLIGENRIFAKYGLLQLERSKREGIKSLIQVSGIARKKIDTGTVGFCLGPRLNASGRMGSCEDALELLMTEDPLRAYALACLLDKENRSRQMVEAKILKEAIGKVEETVNFKKDKVIVLSDESWHQGVIGIVASRLVERFYRPAILIAVENGMGKGSGRSIKHFHLFDALKQSSQYLYRYGGHTHAVGLSISSEHITSFRKAMNEHAQLLDNDIFTPQIEADAELGFDQIDLGFVEQIERMAPFGLGNPKPLFISHNLCFKMPPRQVGESSFKAWVTDGKGVCEVYAPGMKSSLHDLVQASTFSLLYSVGINQWMGQSTLQLTLKDAKTE